MQITSTIICVILVWIFTFLMYNASTWRCSSHHW